MIIDGVWHNDRRQAQGRDSFRNPNRGASIYLAPAMMELITRSQRGRHIINRWGQARALA